MPNQTPTRWLKTKAFFHRVGSPLWRVLKRGSALFPFTLFGLLVGAGAGLSLWYYGLGHLDLLLLVISAAALGFVALSFFLVASAAFVIWLRLRKRQRDEVLALECGQNTRSGFSLRWPLPLLSIRWQWESPEAQASLQKEGGRLHELIKPTRRGFYDAIKRRVEIFDLFGLTSITLHLTEKCQLRILPTTGALRRVEVVRSIAGGDAIPHPRGALDGDRFDMRHYHPGDPLRFVLWKVFAKSRELMVRTPERALSPARQTAVYVVAGKGDEPAAGAARAALEAGVLGQEWVLGADGVASFAKTKSEALEVLARSAGSQEKDSGAGLSHFLRTAAPGGAGRAVVFVPAHEGPWLSRVLSAVKTGAPAGLSFIVCTDGVLPTPKRSRWAKLFFRPDEKPKEARTTNEIRALLRSLQKASSSCVVVDRSRGQVFDAQRLSGREESAA